MKTQNKFFIIIIFLSLIFFGYFVWNSSSPMSNRNLENEKAALIIGANSLINNYTTNEKEANHLYSEKIIQVSGTIKDITFLNDRTTIILNTEFKNFGVICDINKNQENKLKQLHKNQPITIKGICKGFLKDVVLLNCTIDLPQNE